MRITLSPVHVRRQLSGAALSLMSAAAIAALGSGGCNFIVGESFKGYMPVSDGGSDLRIDTGATHEASGGGDAGVVDGGGDIAIRVDGGDADQPRDAGSDGADSRGADDGGDGGAFAACAPSAPWFDLPYPVETAVYDRTLDVIVLLRSDDPIVDIVDPESCSDRPVMLARPGLSIALAPSGRQLAVGEDGAVETVDLATAAVLATYAVPRPASEIAFDSSGDIRIYVRAPRGEKAPLLSVDATSGTQASGTGAIDAAGHLRATPDGTALFWVVDNETSADSFASIDYSSGVLGPDKGLGGALHICHDLFPTDDSQYLISACGTVLRASDLSFQATMQDVKLLQHADTLVSQGLVVSVGAHDHFGGPNGPDDAGFVRVHDSKYFNSVKRIPLPALSVDGMEQIPIGRRAFIRSDGRRFYVLARRGGPLWGPLADGIARLDASDPGTDGGASPGSPLLAVPQPARYDGTPAKITVPVTTAFLSFSIVEAAYSRALNRIVVASDQPAGAVMLVDPDTGMGQTITSTAKPTRVTMSADGLTAAVADQYGVHVLDLQNRTVVATASAGSATFGSGSQLLLGHSDFNDTRTTRLSWFDTGTSQERTVVSAFQNIGFTSLPGTQTFYSATYSVVFPIPLVRHDDTMASGDPSFDIGLLDPMDNTGTPCGSQMWASDDHARLVLDCARVFDLSAARSSDLAYAGQLERTRGVKDVAFDAAHNRLFVAGPTIFQGDTYFPLNVVAVYEGDQLHLKALIDVSGVFDPSPFSLDLHVVRVFAAAAPNRVYAAVTAAGTGLANHDAIVALDVSGL